MTGKALTRAGAFPVLVSAGIAVLVALPSIVNGFVYDDVWIIERHDAVHQLNALWDLLRSPYWPEEHGGVMWRPVALVGYALQWAIGGGQPLLFHAVNIALYGVVVALAALFTLQVFGARVALVAGVLFAVHPVHVEVTANAIGQAELLAGLGYLGALLAALARARSVGRVGRSWLLVAALASFTFGLGGKEHVVTLPGALLIVWWLAARERVETLRAIARREWPVLAGVVAIILGYLMMRAQVAVSVTEAGGLAPVFAQQSALDRVVVMLPVSLHWLRLLFVPIHLSGDYSVQHLMPQPTFGATHAAALFVWGALAVLVWRRRRVPAILAGCALFVVCISVVSNVVVPLQVLLAERFLFLPSLGWAIAMGGVVAAALERGRARLKLPVAVATATVALLFAARSAERATVWRENGVFYVQLIQDAPNSYRSHWAMGSHAFRHGDSVLGERELQTAIRLNPDDPRLLEHLGRIYAASGRYEPAIPILERGLALDSTRLPAALTLSLALARTGRVEKGLEVLETAAEIHGEVGGVLVTRGEVLKRAGQPLAALAALETVIEREPGLWRLRVMAAEALAMAGQCETALGRLQELRSAIPESARADVTALESWVANGNAPCK